MTTTPTSPTSTTGTSTAGATPARVAVITGSGGGIGLAAARHLARDGYAIVIAERDPDLAAAALAELRAAGARADVVLTDVADAGQVSSLFAETLRLHGRLDLLVNNAGIGGEAGAAHEASIDNWDTVMAVNLRGPFLCAREALAVFVRSGGGVIVNVASAFGAVGVRTFPAYCTSKGGVITLTQQLAVEYGAAGVRVNAVLPGYIDNDMGNSRAALSEAAATAALAARESAAALQPAGRQGTVDEVASVIGFLAGDAASFVTGVALPVDGGMLASLNDGGPR